MAKWIEFVECTPNDGRKTKVWVAGTKEGRFGLGTISWYNHWRKYCFFPTNESVFDQNCLREIADFCEQATKEHHERTHGSVLSRP